MRPAIMIFVDWFLPGFKAGGPIQSCANLVDAFADRFHFYIVCGDRDLGDTEPYNGIGTETWIPYKANGSIYYCKRSNLNLPRIQKIVEEVKPDVIYINGIFSWKFSVLPLLVKTNREFKKIVAPRGMLQKGALDLKKHKKLYFLKGMRLLGIYKNVLFHATDHQEALDIQNTIPINKGVFIAGNFPRLLPSVWVGTEKQKGTLNLVYLSRISPKKNILKVLNCLKGIEYCNLCFTIVGAIDDPLYWETCVKAMKEIPEFVQVNIKEPIPNHALSSFYQDQHTFILTSAGENYGHAIVEAMIFGKPVIISDKTPWKDLKRRKIGFDIPLNVENELQEAINKMVAMDQLEYDQWSKAAWSFGNAIQSHSEELKNIYLKNFNKGEN